MSRNIIALAIAGILLFTSMAFAANDAPGFDLKDTEGKKVSLDDLLSENNLLLIDFWQVGCKPCNELMAHLQDYADAYKDDGVAFVVISRDTALTLSQVEPFFKSNEYTFRILLDTDQEVSKDYGVKASPATFIINPDGELIYRHFSYKSGQEKEIKDVIEKFLAGKKVELNDEEEPK